MRLARPRGHYVVLVATLSIFVWFHNVMIFFLIEIDHNRWKLMNLIRIDQQLIKRWSDWSESIRIKRTFWVKRLIRTWKQSNFIKIDMVYQQMKISYLAVMEWILSVLLCLLEIFKSPLKFSFVSVVFASVEECFSSLRLVLLILDHPIPVVEVVHTVVR